MPPQSRQDLLRILSLLLVMFEQMIPWLRDVLGARPPPVVGPWPWFPGGGGPGGGGPGGGGPGGGGGGGDEEAPKGGSSCGGSGKGRGSKRRKALDP